MHQLYADTNGPILSIGEMEIYYGSIRLALEIDVAVLGFMGDF